MKRGLVQIYTGKGKGKTTAAIGQAIRARGRGLRILFVQFLKGKEGSGEIPLLEDVGIKVICKGEKDKWIFPDRLKGEEKKKINFDHPDSIEWDLLIRHLDLLSDGHPISMPTYSYVECAALIKK